MHEQDAAKRNVQRRRGGIRSSVGVKQVPAPAGTGTVAGRGCPHPSTPPFPVSSLLGRGGGCALPQSASCSGGPRGFVSLPSQCVRGAGEGVSRAQPPVVATCEGLGGWGGQDHAAGEHAAHAGVALALRPRLASQQLPHQLLRWPLRIGSRRVQEAPRWPRRFGGGRHAAPALPLPRYGCCRFARPLALPRKRLARRSGAAPARPQAGCLASTATATAVRRRPSVAVVANAAPRRMDAQMWGGRSAHGRARVLGRRSVRGGQCSTLICLDPCELEIGVEERSWAWGGRARGRGGKDRGACLAAAACARHEPHTIGAAAWEFSKCASLGGGGGDGGTPRAGEQTADGNG